MINDCKVKFTKGAAGITSGRIYEIKDGQLTDDDGDRRRSGSTFSSFEDLESWAECFDSDVELVKESKVFTKDDIRSGDKIATEFGRGIVVEFNGKRVIRYDDDTNGHDIVDTISPERIKAVIRPAGDYQLRVDKFSDGMVVFDREKGIGCEPPTPPVKEISVDEATKLLTKRFGKAVRIRVGE